VVAVPAFSVSRFACSRKIRGQRRKKKEEKRGKRKKKKRNNFSDSLFFFLFFSVFFLCQLEKGGGEGENKKKKGRRGGGGGGGCLDIILSRTFLKPLISPEREESLKKGKERRGEKMGIFLSRLVLFAFPQNTHLSARFERETGEENVRLKYLSINRLYWGEGA